MLQTGPAKKVTIYVSEDQQYHGHAVYAAILDFLFYRGVSGATVTRGIAGFGADHRLRTTRLVELAANLPVKIEFIESAEKIDELLGKIREMTGTGLIEIQDTVVVKPAEPTREEHTLPHMPSVRHESAAKMMRIFIGENDKWRGKALYEAIVEALRANNIAGVTVYRGILGYGRSGQLREETTFGLTQERPIMLTVVDEEHKLRSCLPILDDMIDDGLVIMSNVDVIKYTHDFNEMERREEVRQ